MVGCFISETGGISALSPYSRHQPQSLQWGQCAGLFFLIIKGKGGEPLSWDLGKHDYFLSFFVPWAINQLANPPSGAGGGDGVGTTTPTTPLPWLLLESVNDCSKLRQCF